MATVTTPVEGFTGTVAGVEFTDGTGETDNPTALTYFRRHGYTVSEQKKESAPKSTAKRSSAKK